MPRNQRRDDASDEEKESLLVANQPAMQSSKTPTADEQDAQEKHTVVVIPVSAEPKPTASDSMSPGKEVAICRICLEEDAVSNLEQPCACSGTQMYAHHACIQRWVEEKGNVRCEICEQDYKGSYNVPPPRENVQVLTPMYILDGMDPTARMASRAHLELLEESDQYYQRHPGMSWCFTFVIFVMFLVVLHHTMIVADGMDYDGGDGSPSPAGPSPSPSRDDDSDDYASNLMLFLFWVGTKAFLIGIPLYTVMKIAARQARREQYEAMLRAGAYDGNPRVVFRFRPTRAQAVINSGAAAANIV